MAQRGLGKGLDSLIPTSNNNVSREVKQAEMMVKIAKVEPNRDQPRKNFDEDALQELADSIKQFGLLQPKLYRSGNCRDLTHREYSERGLKSDRGGTGIQTAFGGISSQAGRSGRAGFQEQNSGYQQYASAEAL